MHRYIIEDNKLVLNENGYCVLYEAAINELDKLIRFAEDLKNCRNCKNANYGEHGETLSCDIECYDFNKWSHDECIKCEAIKGLSLYDTTILCAECQTCVSDD